MLYRSVFACAVLSVFIHTVTSGELKPFTSDGCSLFPDRALFSSDDWLHCCVAHDYAYWQGGTKQQRHQADQQFQQCVTASSNAMLAQLMFAGVRVGGLPYWPTPFRWGYGWPYLRGYTPLSTQELEAVRQKSVNYYQIYLLEN